MARLLIRGADVLDPSGKVKKAQAIAVDGSAIAAVGEAAPPGFVADETLDGTDLLALPGFFNAHCHAAMTLERGWAEDLPFDRWLNERIWVAESALTEDDVYWGASLAACEMIRSGTVGFADHYFWMDRVAEVVAQSGMKALLAWCWFGVDTGHEVGGTTLKTTEGFVERWHGQGEGRIHACLGPHSPYMCSPEALKKVVAAAEKLETGIHLHVSESREQVETSLKAHGRTPVAHLAALGAFRLPTLAAHCNVVSEDDVEILARHGVNVAHTPKTYLKLAMGMPPLQRLLDHQVRVALGTDGPASNSDLDLMQSMRLTGLVQKGEQGKAEAAPLAQLVRMASRNSAHALGFSSSGKIAPGAAADLVLFDTRATHWRPRHDLLATVVYGAHPSDVRHVLCDGKFLLRDGQLTTLDEERIRFEAEKRAFRMVGRPMQQLREYGG
ncbi:MAG TPA: amidohydrolase [Myxococcales bacterium]|jgi:5-methylthioadenosine/S-adenosylhomocysteine deaminase